MTKSFLKRLIILPILTLAVINLSTHANAEAAVMDPTECKWSGALCPDGVTYREHCLVDGDGNKCTCGTVTRSCD